MFNDINATNVLCKKKREASEEAATLASAGLKGIVPHPPRIAVYQDVFYIV